MATQKQELLAGIIGLIEEFGTKVSERDRAFFEQQSVDFLIDYYKQLYSDAIEKRKDIKARQLLEQAQSEARAKFERDNAETIAAEQAESAAFYRNYYRDQISRVAINGKRVQMNDASFGMIESWLNPGESLNVEWFIKVIKEPGLAERLPWVSASFDSTAADRATFETCARLYGYAINKANWELAQRLGQGFSQYDIEQAIRTGDIQFAPASQEELNAWHQESIQERNQTLLKMDPSALRVAAHQESEQKRAEEHTQQVNDAYEAAKQRDAAIGFPPLPPELTKQEIRNASPERIKYWLKRFGQSQIDARLQGRS